MICRPCGAGDGGTDRGGLISGIMDDQDMAGAEWSMSIEKDNRGEADRTAGDS